jgi:glycosyltransferase involved in cell wall biosynthesis
MRIIQITPGTGNFYCGACQRDHALVTALRAMGHDVMMVPLYLPIVTDEPRGLAPEPIFFGGINVFLQQKSAFFRKTPRWLDKVFDFRPLLSLSSKAAGMTRPHDLGIITLSMLRGEEGQQLKELDRLLEWLKSQPRPDVICLSNALLSGMARRIKQELGVPVVCALQGEDYVLDDLVEPYSRQAWEELTARAQDVDLFIAVSRYFGAMMNERLHLGPGRVVVVHNGIRPDGFSPASTPPHPPVLGFLAFMGLEILVEAFITLKQRGRIPGLKLRAAGTVAGSTTEFLKGLRDKLAAAGFADDAEFLPELNRVQKQEFLRTVSVFSVPATYGEAFGLYLLEAMASGLPLVQPRHGPFPELLEATGGGLLCADDDPAALVAALEELLLDPARARALGEKGRQAVIEQFGVERMARAVASHLENVIARAGVTR